MVKIILPPLTRPHQSNPSFYTLKEGTSLSRIFRTKYCRSPLDFRFYGPLHRFDHHRGNPPVVGYQDIRCEPCDDSIRGISYVAPKFSSCFVEVFGLTPDAAQITDEYWLGLLTPKCDLKLLDIRDNGAMLAGANVATMMTEKRPTTHAWSRYFYEQEDIYPQIHGVIYCNAHNGEDAIAFYERAKELLFFSKEYVYKLTDPCLKGFILKAAQDNNINVIFPGWEKIVQLY